MANTVSYNMGQIRYNTNGDYIQDLKFRDHVIVTPSLSNSVSYRDIILYSDNNYNFSQNESYYLRLNIPRNLSYNMTFDLKLLTRPTNNEAINRNQYQEIKRFVVPRDSSNQITYSKVILYPYDGVTETAEPAVNIVKPIEEAVVGDVYSIIVEDIETKKTEEKFYIKKADEEDDVEIEFKNDVLLNHTWREDVSKDMYPIDFVFSNKVDNVSFNAILLELNRNAYDDDISYEVDGTVYKGLFVGDTSAEEQKETGNIGVECYKINNLITPISGVSSFDSIGVWSHPDAIMSINGEEIRIGQSGYYELNDFNITNFGIVVKDANDRFSLDYQYKVT